MHVERLQRLRQAMGNAGYPAFLSFCAPDNQYLTGFTGDTSAVVVTETDAVFLCDPRFTEQARAEVAAFEVEEVVGNFIAKTGERLKKLSIGTVAVDPGIVTLGQADAVKKAFGGEITRFAGGVAKLRTVKEPGEIDLIRAASDLAEGVLADVVAGLRAGVTEREVAAWIEYEYKRRGASGPSFDTIVLFGARSSLPHGQPGDRALAPGDIVLVDMGCRLANYCSDLTRTFVYGTMPGAWFGEIYQTTLAAQRAALDAVRPGKAAREVDAVARDIITRAGYGKEFGHGLGHGVGIEIHEAPRLSFESDAVLEPGMTITIEPGIYLPGEGGVRIEDLAVVTGDGCALISHTDKELRVLQG